MSDGLSGLSRSKSAGRFGRQQQKQPETLTQNFEVDSDLNVRVKERDPTTAGEERPKSRLMSAIFKGVGGGDPNSSVEQKTTEFKETLKRPLSSLFRRTQSQHDRRAAAATLSSQPTSNALSSLPPQQQPLLRLTPTGRSPIVATNSSSQQSQKGTMGSGRTTMTTNQQQGARGSGVANGNSPGTASVSTTAIRPFSGFPGGRPSLNTQRESTYGQMGDGEQQQLAANTLQTDLSEQASIAPQISLRRLSGISYTSEHNFARRDGGGGLQRRNTDVNFLSRFLCPADETGDERIPWNWDSLFASVSSELREEWALEEEANNGEIPTAAIAGELGTMPNGLNQQQGNGSRNTNSGQWRRN